MYCLLSVLTAALIFITSNGFSIEIQESHQADSDGTILAYKYPTTRSHAYRYLGNKNYYVGGLKRPYYSRSYGYYGITPSRYYTQPYAYHRTPFYYNYPMYYNYPTRAYYIPGGIYSVGW